MEYQIDSPFPDDDAGVAVRIVAVAAGRALEQRLGPAVVGIDMAAAGAFLAGVVGRDEEDELPRARRLVADEVHELAEAGLEHRPVEARLRRGPVRQEPPRLVLPLLRSPRHLGELEVLEDVDQRRRVDDPPAGLVAEVLADVALLRELRGEARLGPPPPPRPLLLAREALLQPLRPLPCLLLGAHLLRRQVVGLGHRMDGNRRAPVVAPQVGLEPLAALAAQPLQLRLRRRKGLKTAVRLGLLLGLVAERDVPASRLADDADGVRRAERPVRLDGQVADVVGLRADEEPRDAVGAALEAEQLARQVDRAAVGPPLADRAAAQLPEEPLVGLVPLDRLVAQDLRRAVRQPRRQLLVLEPGEGLVDGRVGADGQVLAGVGREVPVLVALGVPDDPGAADPLAERPPLRSCRMGLEADACLQWLRSKLYLHYE